MLLPEGVMTELADDAAARRDTDAEPYLVQLLVERPAEPPEDRLHTLLEERCGKTVVERSDGSLRFVFADHAWAVADGLLPAMGLAAPLDRLPDADKLRSALEQTWDWPGARDAVAASTASIVVSDFCARGLDREERLDVYLGMVSSLIELTPCRAILWTPAGKLVDPKALLRSLEPGEGYDPLHSALNVRLFNVEDRRPGELVMDTLGLAPFGLPDVQLHFLDLDPSKVAGFLHGVARYLFGQGPVIEEGDTVPGSDGAPWLCRYEEALVAPERVVIDIEPSRPFSAR
jgi:hypothetical protein